MYIAHIFSIILLSFGAAAFYLGLSAMRKRFRDYKGNILLGMLCFSSSLWSYGFGVLFLTNNTEIAYWGRTIGMLGVFGYMIAIQILIVVLVDIPRIEYFGFCIYALLGIFIYFPVISRNSAIYYLDSWGMTYTFKPGLINNIYTLYAVIFAINMSISIYHMIKYSENKRSKVTGYRMIITLLIVFIGMILDTVIPMFGLGAIPGSSISQFLGLLTTFYAIVDYNGTRITDRNMSQYVYSSFEEPVLVLDTKGMLKLMNKAAEKILPDVILQNANREFHICDVLELRLNHLSYQGENRLDDSYIRNNHTPVQVQTNKIKDKYGDLIGYVLTVKDMTEIVGAMKSLRDAKLQAEASNLAKSSFLANMSHEIRTPLNAIVGFSELLLKGNIDAESKDYVEDILNSSYNLLAIINDILDISKIESNKMELNEEPYDIGEVIKDAYLITDNIAQKKGLDFTIEVDESIPSKLYGDSVRIRGILVNILNNAVKYTPKGSVSFKCEYDKIEDNTVYLSFSVIDSGIGIKENDIPKLFETFLRVDKEKNTGIEGTGLGLAIVKGFLYLMGGDISVASTYGEGTTFTIHIPQKIVDEKPIGAIKVRGGNAKSSISDVKYRGVKVLVVDDNGVNLKVVSQILMKYEMDVTTARSGEEAIELCVKDEFDIILMDQMMPVMDGVEAMMRIREISGHYAQGGKCAIVALTANAILGVRDELIGLGFDDYLSKPIEFNKLEEVLGIYCNSDR